MAKGIAITITRVIETREPYPGERWSSIWNGRKWISLSSHPYPPGLASIYGYERDVQSTRLEFLPPGTITIDMLHYRQGLLKEMQKQSVIR